MGDRDPVYGNVLCNALKKIGAFAQILLDIDLT